MCIFVGPVDKVENTCIFVRKEDDKQYVVYQMDVKTPKENAMVLPLPVANNEESDVEFIDLSDYPEFFKDIEENFSEWRLTKGYGSDDIARGFSLLEVFSVGDFEASFVPTVKDFDRLDEVFRLDPKVWKELPSNYSDYGFAVFKLKSSAIAKAETIHPMAFSFKTKLKDKLFFPTVHLHDGKVHREEKFDHRLYFQTGISDETRLELDPEYNFFAECEQKYNGWKVSNDRLSATMNMPEFVGDRVKEIDKIDKEIEILEQEIVEVRKEIKQVQKLENENNESMNTTSEISDERAEDLPKERVEIIKKLKKLNEDYWHKVNKLDTNRIYFKDHTEFVEEQKHIDDMTKGIVNVEQHALKKTMVGTFPNKDVIVEL